MTTATPGTPGLAQPELIVILDEGARPALTDIFAAGCVRIIDCQDVGELSSIGDDPILIDVDLHDISKVKLIKDNLPDRAGTFARSLPSIAGATCPLFKPRASVQRMCSGG